MNWIGLTGGIATGKSTVARLIEGRGFPVIDADQISHQLSQPNEAGYKGIVSHFGTSLLNDEKLIDRQKLGALIFSDRAHKASLEAILHPLIQVEVKRRREEHLQKGHTLCFYDVPLLFEKNLESQFNSTVMVWCNPAQQLERLMKRSHLTKEDAVLRMSNQMSLLDKVRRAHHCLDNSGDAADISKQLDRLLQRLQTI